MSSLIIVPQGFRTDRIKETLTRDEIDLVTKFEAWCHRRGLVLDLICGSCLEQYGKEHCRVSGDNAKDSTAYHIRCNHADRVYGEGN